YAWVIYQTVRGTLTVGTLTFLAGAISGTSSNIQTIFSTCSSIASQALFLKDLLDVFAVQPTIRSMPSARSAPRPFRHGIEFRDISFAYPGRSQLVLRKLNFEFRT